MNMQAGITEDVEPVATELHRIFVAKTTHASHANPWFEHLWNTAAACAVGGKFVRPRLFLNALRALAQGDEHDAQQSIQIAAAIELLHYSFLLHDDVIDGDTTRRGRPNLIGALARADTEGSTPERRLHWARSCAILMGNLLLAEVHQIVAAAELDDDRRVRLLDLLSHTITESVIGEQLDVGLSDLIVPADLSTVLSMCASKTATYSFEFPLRAASVIAGAPRELDPVLAQAGHLLGLSFQLQDDLLSMFVDATDHGKDPFSDLREGKETALIAYARMTSCWPGIERVFGQALLAEADGLEVRALLDECGAKEFVESLIEEQIRALHELLAEHHEVLPVALTRLILTIANDLEGRTS